MRITLFFFKTLPAKLTLRKLAALSVNMVTQRHYLALIKQMPTLIGTATSGGWFSVVQCAGPTKRQTDPRVASNEGYKNQHGAEKKIPMEISLHNNVSGGETQQIKIKVRFPNYN